MFSELWRHPVSQQRDAVSSNHRQVVDPPQRHAGEEGGDAVVLQLARNLKRSFAASWLSPYSSRRLCFSSHATQFAAPASAAAWAATQSHDY